MLERMDEVMLEKANKVSVDALEKEVRTMV
jgi:hypothetical protein